MFVLMNASPAVIERSTWLSAARRITWSGAKAAKAPASARRSHTSILANR